MWQDQTFFLFSVKCGLVKVPLIFLPCGCHRVFPRTKLTTHILVPILGIFVGPNKELGADANTVVRCWHVIDVECITNF